MDQVEDRISDLKIQVEEIENSKNKKKLRTHEKISWYEKNQIFKL